NRSARGIHFMDNVLPSWADEVQISGDDGFEGVSKYSFKVGKGPYHADQRPIRRLEGFRFNKPRIKYTRFVDPTSGKVEISNENCVEEEQPSKRLFWGHLKCHSILGDGIRVLEELHAFARDVSLLNTFSLTDHTEALSDAQWNYFGEI